MLEAYGALAGTGGLGMARATAWQTLRRLGKYELVERLGVGGCGSVYKGRDPDTGAPVAIKVLKPEVAADAGLLQRFVQEFATTRTLVSPHIVRALEYGHEGGVPFLVMEFVEGQDLWRYVTSRGRLPEAEAVAIIRQVAEALHEAHEQGVIHRDVKPDNVLLTADGHAKLTDFGLVKDLDSELNLTETSTVLGTPNFMAPEQFENAKAVDRRCDVYALAATLYMAVTGEVPFHTRGFLSTMEKKLNGDITPARQLVPELGEQVERALLAALSVNPDERPATCLEFVKALTEPGRRPAPRTRAGAERRTATRFACGLDTSCRPLGGERRTRWKARVTDLSAMGIGLLLSRRFEPGTVLLLEVRGAGASVRRLVVRVARVQQQGPRWSIGCQLGTNLTPLDLQELLASAGGGKAVPFWLRGGPQAPAEPASGRNKPA
jgi:serine/threonine protein kinase